MVSVIDFNKKGKNTSCPLKYWLKKRIPYPLTIAFSKGGFMNKRPETYNVRVATPQRPHDSHKVPPTRT